MTSVAVMVGLVSALWIGFLLGRHTRPGTQTWRQRTTRSALGRQAVVLMVLVAANTLQRRLPMPGRHRPATPLDRLRSARRRLSVYR
ncbi:hypothetical protein JDV09_15275 [Mycobacterium sp. Y57]|uniref:hypothetical protein n=1 Tax=Mycolicibacterium xanthum TaxID=2796469 RepID=UPI001C8549D7|nr:hypothetical protein [Mycolicibacterium xanthum]MBX7433461.1 hypothetical protein [Mycolicibacterium xanthum]